MKALVLSLGLLASSAFAAKAQYYYNNNYENDYEYQQEQMRLEGQERMNDAIRGANEAAGIASSGCLVRRDAGPCPQY